MAEWRECSVGDLGTVVGGGTPPRERPEYWDGTVRWLTPSELTHSRQKSVSETQDHLSDLGLAASGATLLPQGSLLVTSRATIGSCALAGAPLATNQGFKNLIPSDDVDPSFLYYLAQTLSREMIRRASGTTFLEISAREFQRIKIYLPSLDEQRRIAQIIDTLDEAVRATEYAITKHKKIRAGLASNLLSAGPPELRIRIQDHDETLQFIPASTQLNMSADAWTSVQVRDLVRHVASGPSPTCEERTATESEWGLLKTTAITWSGWDETAHKVPPVEYWGNEALEVQKDDVIITKAGPRHRVAVVIHVPTTRSQLMVSGKMVLLRPDQSQVPARLLADLLATPQAQKFLDDRTTGMAEAQTNFTNESLLDTPLRIPPLEQQKWIVGILDATDETIQSNEEQLAKLQGLRSGLVTDLLSGRVSTIAA